MNAPELIRFRWSSFCLAAVVWLAISLGVMFFLSEQRNFDAFAEPAKWLVIIWTLSIIDFFVIVRLMQSVFGIIVFNTGAVGESMAGLVIRASTWGTIKLGFIILFAFLVVKAQGVPPLVWFLGTGTWCFVPVVGGLIEYRRGLKNE